MPNAAISKRTPQLRPRLLAVSLLAWSALFGGAAAAQSPPDAPEPDALRVELSGLYNIWGLNQHGFLLGAEHPLNDADYVVQMLRAQLRLGKNAYGVITRIDAAQGWWGVDNSPDNVPSVTEDASGQLSSGVTYNPYKLFGSKDTNYTIHVDHAYLYLDIPSTPLRLTAGRQYFSVGNKLVLDHDHDGIIASATLEGGSKAELLWARISEGRGSYKTPTAALLGDEDANADADLLGARFLFKRPDLQLELFGLYYLDRSHQADYAYLPDGLGYLQARFTPQLSQVWAFGLAGTAHLDLLQGLDLTFEADYLFGEDRVHNTDHAGGLLDINDGTLQGYNLLLQATQHVELGIPWQLAVTLGRGSGDDDPTRGAGNLNKVQTMGSFALTNVWEDSIMPDIGGIFPQGLGSPVSRGYRELENTTTLLLQLTAHPLELLQVEVAWALLRATRPVRGFDAAGSPSSQRSQALGQEVDLNARLAIYAGVSYELRLGYFMPGDAAALLINGNTLTHDPAWEAKQAMTLKF